MQDEVLKFKMASLMSPDCFCNFVFLVFHRQIRNNLVGYTYDVVFFLIFGRCEQGYSCHDIIQFFRQNNFPRTGQPFQGYTANKVE